MSSIIILILISAVITILVYLIPAVIRGICDKISAKKGADYYFEDEEKQERLLNNLQLIIDEKDEICDEICEIANEKLDEASDNRDYVNLNKLCGLLEKYNSLNEEYKKESDICIAALKRSKYTIAKECADRLEELTESYRDILEAAKKIQILYRENNTEYETFDNENETNASNQSSYFSSCKNMSELKSTYRTLIKVYHPDSPTGNEAMFKRIQEEYETMKKTIK